MQKFRPQEGCAWCVHILGMERDCLLGSFKVMKYILDRFWARGYSACPPRQKSAHFRPKIADLPKFRCRNFGRGCPERPNFFWTTKLHYFRQKNFHGRTKILSSSLKNPGRGKGSPPPNNAMSRLVDFVGKRQWYRFATKSSKSDFGGRFGLSLPEHSLWSFNHSEMIMVWKMFYFFQKSQKYSKKGLGRGKRTHMAHLKFLLAGSAVKIENFLGFSPASWSVPIGCKYSPKPFSARF